MKIVATLSLLFAFGCAPNGETPGMRLGGSISAVPESFAFLKDTPVIQLEARGFLLPRVVNIWGVGFDNAIYVWSDIGSAFGIDATAPGLVDKAAPRVSIGVGISWKSPFGPIRVDLGFPIVKQSFDKEQLINFTFGTRF